MRKRAEAIYTEIGKLIRNARIRRQLSQDALGNLLHPPKTRACISLLERGEQRLLPHILIGIAEALGMPSTELLPVPGNCLPLVRKAISVSPVGNEQLVIILAKDIKASRARRV